MVFPTEPVPVEERLADRLSHRHAQQGAAPSPTVRALRRLGDYDRAAYGSVARALHAAARRTAAERVRARQPLQAVDPARRRSSRSSDARGRRAAFAGLAAVAAASLVVNQPMKIAGARPRPDRDDLGVPQPRRVRMPSSTSFPSGHSASAAAFAVAVGDLVPG